MAKILVIDDDPYILELIVHVLKSEGHELFQAENGHVGLDLFREHRPELLITDMVMPEKDGLSTIMEINHEFPGSKIIAISGGGAIEPQRYLNLAEIIGVIDTILKPLSRIELLDAVNNALAMSHPSPSHT